MGPVPLSGFHPGTYKARIKVKDQVSGKEYVKEATFEIKAAEAEPEAQPEG